MRRFGRLIRQRCLSGLNFSIERRRVWWRNILCQDAVPHAPFAGDGGGNKAGNGFHALALAPIHARNRAICRGRSRHLSILCQDYQHGVCSHSCVSRIPQEERCWDYNNIWWDVCRAATATRLLPTSMGHNRHGGAPRGSLQERL